jgi:tetratricopeptide (TPR) repeat protein
MADTLAGRSLWRNPALTAIAGALIGFCVGYIIAQRQTAVPALSAPAQQVNPHEGVAGAPALSGMPQRPPEGGRTAAAADPMLLQQVREIEALLAKDPTNYDHLVRLGNLHYDLNNYAKAAEYYEKARTVKDDSPDVLTDLGVCYRESGQGTKALALFDRAADLQPQHWQSRYNAAIVRLFDLNDLSGARQELEKLKKLKGSVRDIPDLAGLEQEIARRGK